MDEKYLEKINDVDDVEILETGKKRFQLGIERESENKANAIEDLEFRAGEQWDQSIKTQREEEKRPCLTINKISGNVHQITNDQRKNRPAIKVSPVDDNADKDIANIYQGLIRSIERNSDADTAYDLAFENSVSGGLGFFRVITKFCSHYSFDQEAAIEQIEDFTTVVTSPFKKLDGSDMTWAFIFEDIPEDDFKEMYPDAEASEDSFGWDTGGYWYKDKHVRIAEYYDKKLESDILIKLPDGSTILQSEINKWSDEELEEFDLTKELINNLPKRKTLVPKVYHYKITGNKILEKTIFPSQWIPVIPVIGIKLVIEGKKILEGIIRHAKDPQRMYNYWATCATETIALAPKAPYIGAEGQFDVDHEKWHTAHIKNYPYIQYKPTILNDGTVAPPPQRQLGEPPIQAITQARLMAADDLKSTTNIYDASIGNRSNETSGIAISRRVQQSESANFHFVDNLNKSIRHTGRILVDIIPKIYDSPRTIRILGIDDKEELIAINKIFKDDKGRKVAYNLNIGKYDVDIDNGPSYSTKRQEASESMLALAKAFPEMTKIIGDLMVKNFDWPMADEIAERLKKLVPPGILNSDNEDFEIPPGLKAQIDQMNKMIEELTNKLNEAQDKIENNTIEIESKERIEMAKIEADLAMKDSELRAQSNANPNELNAIRIAIFELGKRLDTLHFNTPINEDEIAENLENEMSQVNNNPTGGMAPGSTGMEPPTME